MLRQLFNFVCAAKRRGVSGRQPDNLVQEFRDALRSAHPGKRRLDAITLRTPFVLDSDGAVGGQAPVRGQRPKQMPDQHPVKAGERDGIVKPGADVGGSSSASEIGARAAPSTR